MWTVNRRRLLIAATCGVLAGFAQLSFADDKFGEYTTMEDATNPYSIDLPEGDGPFPVILFVHSWSGSRSQLRAYSQRLAAMGIAGVRIDYRKLSEGATFAEAFEDVTAALDFIRATADKYRFDLERIGICGASAGAVVSSRLAQDAPDLVLLIAFNGGFDLVERGSGSFPSRKNLLSMFGADSGDLLEEASAIHRLRPKPPKTLLLHGTADKVIDCEQSSRFAGAIEAVGGRSKVILYEGEGHGFFNSDRPRFEEVYTDVEKFVLESFAQ